MQKGGRDRQNDTVQQWIDLVGEPADRGAARRFGQIESMPGRENAGDDPDERIHLIVRGNPRG
jgi:hypothetical protein